jgi:glycolate oxidase
VGLEKSDLIPLIFSEFDLEMMRRIKSIFNPQGSFNPGKVLPTGKMCGELRVEMGAGGVV